MKTVKNYDNFSEEYRLNENLLKKAWNKIVDYFKSKFKMSWLFHSLYLKKLGLFPNNKVRIVLPDSANISIPVPSETEVESATESVNFDTLYASEINEEVINLKHPDPNIRNVDVPGLIKKVRRVYEMNKERVERGEKRTKTNAVFIWGAPGIGKTEIIGQLANELGIPVIEFILSQIDPTDMRGVPKVINVKGSSDARDERTVWALPDTFPTSDDNSEIGLTGKGGILFFDELNRANKMVLNAALSLTLNGKIDKYELPPHWIVIAAGNRPSDLGGGVATRIEPALANRFGHINYAPKVEDWLQWAIAKPNINPDVVNFIKFQPDYWHKLDPDQEPEPIAFPTPRSWEQASQEEYSARGYNWENPLSIEEIQDIYTDYIGAEAAIKFAGYLELKKFYNEKDVEKVFKEGRKAKALPTNPNQMYAATSSIASYKKGKKLTVEELKNFLDFATNLKEVENLTTLLSHFIHVHPECKTDDPWKPIWWEGVKKWNELLKKTIL